MEIEMNLDQPCGRIADVNRLLDRAGHPERLYKGKGYMYWADGTTPSWKESMIYVHRLSDMTIREYLEDHNRRVCAYMEASK
jgi:hypothetical protein